MHYSHPCMQIALIAMKVNSVLAIDVVILIVTSKIPRANGNSLWRTCKIIGNPVKNGNQLKINAGKRDHNNLQILFIIFISLLLIWNSEFTYQIRWLIITYHNRNVTTTTTPSLAMLNILEILWKVNNLDL